jgi:uncharacterized membrane protein (UPF0127 family)
VKRTPLVLTLLLLAAGCDKGSTPDATTLLPTTTMQIGGQPFVLEKALTPGEQMTGLMRRDSLAPDHGMIFVFPQATTQVFWNKNVRFPLDNLFLDDSARIVSIQHMDAYDETDTQPVVARYVIELNAGVPARLGLKTGDQLTLPVDVLGQ